MKIFSCFSFKREALNLNYSVSIQRSDISVLYVCFREQLLIILDNFYAGFHRASQKLESTKLEVISEKVFGVQMFSYRSPKRISRK